MIGSSKSAFEGGACHPLSLSLFPAARHPSPELAVSLQGWPGCLVQDACLVEGT